MGITPPDSLRLLLNESRSTSPSNSKCFVDVSLPQELITEILIRVPVKSLLKFKLVSKPWLSLISNPQFISSHFSKSSSSMDPDDLNLQLLFVTKDSIKKCSLYSALQQADPSTHVSAIEFPAEIRNTLPIVGIVKGLVCLILEGTDLCVWNPALNKIKYFNVYPEAPSGHVAYYFSFGYDELNDDYKVVYLQTVDGEDGVLDTEVRIYSLKADSWRRIDCLKWFYLHDPGVFAYGKIYWSGDVFATPNLKYVSLDMSSEKFAELQPPEYDQGPCLLKMGVSRGRLLVLCDYFNGNKADLWVLDNRGAEESWCRLASIPDNDVISKTRMFSRVLCFLSNGKIVYGYEDGLIVYDWKKKESRKIKLDVGITSCWRVAAYAESLVWPNYA